MTDTTALPRRRDPHTEYWRESLDIALDEIGALDKLTDEEKDSIAGALCNSAENRSTAFGWSAIPNPENTEISRLKRALAEAEKDAEKRERLALKALGSKIRLDPGKLSIRDDGRVFYTDGRTEEVFV